MFRIFLFILSSNLNLLDLGISGRGLLIQERIWLDKNQGSTVSRLYIA